MIPERLKKGDTIGICSPSHIATHEGYDPIIATLEEYGFKVRTADNLFASSWGYAATDRERADDINQLINDDEVKLIFFGGGEGADDVLPLIDYDAARRHPKLWLSYSDGTSILDTVYSRAGVNTYYGQAPGKMQDISEYNLAQFNSHIMAQAHSHTANGEWHTLNSGVAQGTLIGGYLDNFIFLVNSGWVQVQPGEKYLLFIEDHEMFFGIEHESDLLSRLEYSPIMKQATGLLFGNYSTPVNAQLLERLARLGKKWGIPVAYCDDFGHGANHAILPIGAAATLDADAHTLTY